jgi:transposase-like protein/Zn ribbon nucleic-acid-binding protein
MKEYPMTFDEFTTKFATEDQCRDYLYDLRFPDGFVCPKCKEQVNAWRISEILYECPKCGRQTSVIAGTIFHDTRKPLRTWFTAIWWVTTQKNGASASGLQQILGLGSYKTAWTWLHKIRTAMVNPNRKKLSGVIEVDETYIGSEEKDGKRGRGTENKSLVVLGVELLKGRNQLGRVRMQVVPDASKKSLQSFIKENVEPGSTVITDGWSSYNSINESGYTHIVPPKFETADGKKLLPHVHMIISLLKRWLLGTHQGAVREVHLQAYLDEYVFRFNRRKSAKRGLLFYRLLECAMQTSPTTLDELLGHKF